VGDDIAGEVLGRAYESIGGIQSTKNVFVGNLKVRDKMGNIGLIVGYETGP
jgi:hypothetical protein